MIDLPYFDLLLEGRKHGEAASKAFERNVHWGFWPDPSKARQDESDFVAAMDRLNNEMLAAADIRNGMSLLDVGCGFGGTLEIINKRHQGMQLAGVNIDPRQLEIASKQVKAGYDNSLKFIEADACALPFEGNGFQRVLAVECIFHFPSRLRFLKEAARVLRPGGRLVLSDFVPVITGGGEQGLIHRWIAQGYGSTGADWRDGTYKKMAREAGLEIVLDRDITSNTLPTYRILLNMIQSSGRPEGRRMVWPTRLLWLLSSLRLVRYHVLGFVKPQI